jgi:hypothetical protein
MISNGFTKPISTGNKKVNSLKRLTGATKWTIFESYCQWTKPGRFYMKEIYTTNENSYHMKRFGNIKRDDESFKDEVMQNFDKEIAGDEKYHDLTKEQWQWAVNMIKEFELNQDGAKILIEEIKKGNFVFD